MPLFSDASLSIAPTEIVALCQANILTPNGLLKNSTLQMQGGFIKSVGTDLPVEHLLRDDDIHRIELNQDFLVTPGLIDLQLNGAFGIDFSTGPLPQLQRVLDRLPEYGVTSVLPTLVTAPIMEMVNASNALEELLHFNPRSQGAKVLGIHLEGPFLNPQKCGTHAKSSIIPMDLAYLEALLSPHVRMVTYAPECDEGLQGLQYLQDRGILVFAGHTQADRQCLQSAMALGLKGVTHLYNAMEGFQSRQVGTSLHVLNEPDLWASIIADGYHVHPDVLELTLRIKGKDRLILVSDAMPLAGLTEDSTVTFAGTTVYNQAGRALNTAGQLAGSTQLLPDMIRRLLAWNWASLEAVFQWATSNPARLLGIDHERGALAVGYHADVVLWHQPTMKIMATWVEGHLRWCDPSLLAPLSPPASKVSPPESSQAPTGKPYHAQLTL
jgi:N-acetylglucosamine-6-phosphate deacetylase